MNDSTCNEAFSMNKLWQTLHAEHFLVPFFSFLSPPGVNYLMFPKGCLVKIQRRFPFSTVKRQHPSLETRYCVNHYTIHLTCVGVNHFCHQLGEDI